MAAKLPDDLATLPRRCQDMPVTRDDTKDKKHYKITIHVPDLTRESKIQPFYPDTRHDKMVVVLDNAVIFEEKLYTRINKEECKMKVDTGKGLIKFTLKKSKPGDWLEGELTRANRPTGNADSSSSD